jgi:hypothetical protein
MAKDFRETTDELFVKLGAEELAAEICCSLGAVKQARLDPDSRSYRAPPPGWETAARKLAERQAAYFTKLAKRLATG